MSQNYLKMSPETIQAPFSYTRTRPRAATDRARVSSRQSLQAMSPPSMVMCRSPSAETQTTPGGSDVRARATSGSLRHPKPLSPSDIHSILEQEQEAMVNRLSRELSLLRRQTASVASTASSTSTSLNDTLDTLHGSSYMTPSTSSTASRRHRSSSSLSGSYFPVIQGSRTGGRSRRPSFPSSQRSQSLASVASQPPERKRDPSAPHIYNSRLFFRRSSVSQRTPSGSGVSRSDEVAVPRKELESMVQENEALLRRIRDLELELSAQKTDAHKSIDQPS
ncbi:hypothetical protein BJX99DRAFT_228957 [Aspergillus californicus]